jgi:hypothetical protein
MIVGLLPIDFIGKDIPYKANPEPTIIVIFIY